VKEKDTTIKKKERKNLSQKTRITAMSREKDRILSGYGGGEKRREGVSGW